MNKWYKFLLDPAENADGGGNNQGTSDGVFEDVAQSNEQQGTGQTSKPDSGTAARPNVEKAAEPTLTPDQIAAAFKKAGVVVPGQVAPAQQQRQFTQEDFDRTFKVFKPTAKMLASLKKAIADGDEGEGLAALNELAHGVYQQSATMAAYLVQKMQNDFEPRLAPLQAMYQKHQEDQLWSRFQEKNPDLKGQRQMVEVVTRKLFESGFQGNEEEAFQLVADQTRIMFQQMFGDSWKDMIGKTQTQQQQTQAQSAQRTSASRMSTLSGGGQVGAGDGSARSNGKNRPAGMEVFDE